MPGLIASPVLVGRTREMEILDQALQATQKGTGSCILLTGKAGIGKSRVAATLKRPAMMAMVKPQKQKQSRCGFPGWW